VGEVDGGNVAHLGEFGSCVVFEEGEDGDDALRGDVDGEFILPDGESAWRCVLGDASEVR